MKGACNIQYAYRPHHSWRHGYRREKRRTWFFRIVKALLVAEGVILAGRYIEEHTYEQVYEREETVSEDDRMEIPGMEADEDVFGIGIGAEDGSLFWFHKRIETFRE